jgi:hypothetical protein
MSQFRVEKRRADAELTLSTGETLRGCFFLASANATQAGPERVVDLLNNEPGFFPFDPSATGSNGTVLINRAHLISVKLPEVSTEARLDAGYDVAAERQVTLLLSNGVRLKGAVRVYRPQGRDRLSDYARWLPAFSYLEGTHGTFIVNSAHVVELREMLGHADRSGEGVGVERGWSRDGEGTE